MTQTPEIPSDWPVQPIHADNVPDAIDPAGCGSCGLLWDDGIITGMTPAPGARCPFESFHVYEDDDDVADVENVHHAAILAHLDDYRDNVDLCLENLKRAQRDGTTDEAEWARRWTDAWLMVACAESMLTYVDEVRGG